MAHGEIESHHPRYLGSQNTCYVGILKGVRRIYQQTIVDNDPVEIVFQDSACYPFILDQIAANAIYGLMALIR